MPGHGSTLCPRLPPAVLVMSNQGKSLSIACCELDWPCLRFLPGSSATRVGKQLDHPLPSPKHGLLWPSVCIYICLKNMTFMTQDTENTERCDTSAKDLHWLTRVKAILSKYIINPLFPAIVFLVQYVVVIQCCVKLKWDDEESLISSLWWRTEGKVPENSMRKQKQHCWVNSTKEPSPSSMLVLSLLWFFGSLKEKMM